MSHCKKIIISESIEEIRELMRGVCPLVCKRLHILLVCKQYESTGISKRELQNLTGCGHSTAIKWRNEYEQHGIESLLFHKLTNHRQTVISKDDLSKIEEKLNDAHNPLTGYIELQQWIETVLGKKVSYTTMYNYIRRHCDTKIKAVRPSHINKDPEAVEAFKKTLHQSVIQS